MNSCLSRSSYTGSVALGLISVLLVFTLSGCMLLDRTQMRAAVSMGDAKKTLLSERLNAYQKAMYWGEAEAALGIIEEGSRRDIYPILQKTFKKSKIVDIKGEVIVVNEDGSGADTEVVVRYFKLPSNQVLTKTQKIYWRFDRFNGGWFIRSLEEVEDGDGTDG